MSEFRTRTRFLVATALAGCLATAANAQQAGTEPAKPTTQEPSTTAQGKESMIATQAAEQSRGGIEDIVVTARKSEENQQRVPIAITTVTAQALTDLSVRDVIEIQKVTPGLYISAQNTGGRARLVIRGQGEADSRLTTDSSVGVYIDGVNIIRSYGLRASLIDIAQVEVLKGPQGTLFGKNTTGGALNITTQRPLYELGGFVDAAYGNYNNLQLLGVVNVPLVDDKLAVRIAGQRLMRDGFGENALGQEMGQDDVINGRIHIRADPAPNINILLSADYVKQDTPGNNIFPTFQNMLATGPNSATGALGAIARELGLNPASAADRQIAYQRYLTFYNQYQNGSGGRLRYGNFGNSGYEGSRDDFEHYGVSAQLAVDVTDDIAFKSITSYRELDRQTDIDFDGTPFTLLDAYTATEQSNFSQEFQLNSIDNAGLDWQLGLFYNKEDGVELSYNNTNNAVNTARSNVTDTESHNRSKAIYGQAVYNFGDQFRVTLGGRYTKDTRGIVSHNRIDPALAQAPFPPAGLVAGRCNLLAPAAGGPVFPNCNYETSVDFSRFTWLVSADYRPTRDIMLYASVSRGYRAGGYSAQASSSVSASQAQLDAFFTPFEPETVTNYETGFKSDLLGRRLRINGSVYYQDYKDIQVQIRDIVTAAGGSAFTVTLIRNAAEARLYGGELEVVAAPTDNLRLTASAAYVNAKYKTFLAVDTSGNVVDLSAQPFASPKWQANAGATYTVPMSDGELRFNVNYAYTSNVAFRADTPTIASTSQKAFSLVDARAAWDVDSIDTEFALYVKNLFNKKYLTGATNLEATGYNVGFPAEPRLYGVQIRKRF